MIHSIIILKRLKDTVGILNIMAQGDIHFRNGLMNCMLSLELLVPKA